MAANDSYKRSTKRNEFFLSTRFLTRPLAYPVALLAERIGLSPNAVTVVGGMLWVASVPLFVMGGRYLGTASPRRGWALLLAGACLWPAGVILDVADGSLARMTGKSSSAGYYLDFVFHMIFSPMFLAGIGASLYLSTGHVMHLVVGLLSICANWGPSYAAKDHVICEAMATRTLRPEKMSRAERADLLLNRIDASTLSGATASGRWQRLWSFGQEALFFPGQFSLFWLATVLDALLWHAGIRTLPALQALFLLVALLAIVRVPFRIRREFLGLRKREALFRSQSGGAQ